MSYLIIGASSGLGRELALRFAKEKNNLILISRDIRDLNAIKSDLEHRHGIKVKCIEIDFSSIEEINQKLFINEETLKNLKGILFPIGLMFEHDNFELNINDASKLIYANFLSISFTLNKLSGLLNKQNASIVGFGSVSGLLGRNLNPNYSAAKRGLESYFESLAFEEKFQNTKIQFYILGYLDTNLAFGKKIKLPKGSTKKLANIVYKNKNINLKKTFYPKFWNLIGFALKILPFSLLIKLYKIFK